ncbi:hypothetical protein Tco_0527558 [Tanacetum coccineum]
MISFRLLHSHLKALSNTELKGTRIEGCFERAFASHFDQDVQTFTGSMLLNLDLLEKQLDKEEFQETRSVDAFRVLKKQFQWLINFRYYFDDDDGLMIHKFFLVYTQTEHVSKNKSGNDTLTKDADINPMNDKQPMAEVQPFAKHNILANEQHFVQSESIYDTYLLEKVDRNTTPDLTNMCHREGEIDQNAKKCQVSCPLLDPSFDNMTTEFSNQFSSRNILSNKTVAQLLKGLFKNGTQCVYELKYQNQVYKKRAQANFE